jgi:hypothetical protein
VVVVIYLINYMQLGFPQKVDTYSAAQEVNWSILYLEDPFSCSKQLATGPYLMTWGLTNNNCDVLLQLLPVLVS